MTRYHFSGGQSLMKRLLEGCVRISVGETEERAARQLGLHIHSEEHGRRAWGMKSERSLDHQRVGPWQRGVGNQAREPARGQ